MMGVFVEIKKVEQNAHKVVYRGLDKDLQVYFNIDIIAKLVLVCLDNSCHTIFQVIDFNDKDIVIKRPPHISADAYGRMIIKIGRCLRENNYPEDISWQS